MKDKNGRAGSSVLVDEASLDIPPPLPFFTLQLFTFSFFSFKNSTEKTRKKYEMENLKFFFFILDVITISTFFISSSFSHCSLISLSLSLCPSIFVSSALTCYDDSSLPPIAAALSNNL